MSDSIIDQTISHYHVIAKLGGGGMGDVYKARDLALDRTVAFEEVAEAVAAAARTQWPGSWTTADVRCSVDDIARFEDPDWTLRR